MLLMNKINTVVISIELLYYTLYIIQYTYQYTIIYLKINMILLLFSSTGLRASINIFLCQRYSKKIKYETVK